MKHGWVAPNSYKKRQFWEHLDSNSNHPAEKNMFSCFNDGKNLTNICETSGEKRSFHYGNLRVPGTPSMPTVKEENQAAPRRPKIKNQMFCWLLLTDPSPAKKIRRNIFTTTSSGFPTSQGLGHRWIEIHWNGWSPTNWKWSGHPGLGEMWAAETSGGLMSWDGYDQPIFLFGGWRRGFSTLKNLLYTKGFFMGNMTI